MSRRLRRSLIWIGLAVSLFFTWLALRDVDVSVFLDGLRESNYAWLIPSFLVLAAAVLVRALRWRLMFVSEREPPVKDVTVSLLIGYLFNNILPARAGDPIRALVLHQRTGISRGEALGTVGTERVFDTICLLLLLFVAQPFLPEVSWIRNAAMFAAVVGTAVLAFVFVVARYDARPIAWLLRPFARLPKVSPADTEQAAVNIVRGLEGFRNLKLASIVFLVTLVSWLMVAASVWLLTFAFDLKVGFGAAVLITIAANLALILPSSPGGLGVFEAAVLAALSAYGISASEALSYAVVLHGLNFFPYIVVGYLVLHRHSARMRQTEKMAGAPSLT